ncbi:Thioredoxin [Oryctes borbonicus]|uniref:Thioredoxin n=1 Tax=Oryctes borbonicus TaxID=1629725 RepID=A0A0T6B8U2_9SCAR|nr:Thioredoxin [Oryctes borbonicus]
MNFCFLTGVLCLLSVIDGDEVAEHTIQYTVDNFDEEIPKRNHFVMFYAPWCGHSQRLTPTWEQLAEMLNEDDGNVRIAKVDCMKEIKICSDRDITGYPTLKFFKIGELQGVRFRGTRDLPSLSNFINEQLGSQSPDDSPQIPEPVHGVIELTEDTFYDHVTDGKHFVKFYAPWCGHCQKLAPTWEELAQSLEFEEAVTICKIDCTQYRTLCNEFEVKGYPSLLWIEDGKKVDKYQGSRSHEDLKAYVNKMLGSKPTEKENVIDESKEEPQSLVLVLSGDNFVQGIKKGISFVKFFAPWCGHCKRLAPTWEELGKKFVNDNSVNIVKVDCTLEINKELCKEQEVDGFPSVFLYKNGQKVSEYTGNRSLEDLVEFVLKHSDGHDEL